MGVEEALARLYSCLMVFEHGVDPRLAAKITVIVAGSGGASLDELAEATGVSKTTAWRVMNTLAGLGIAVRMTMRVKRRGKPKILYLLARDKLAEAAEKCMEELREAEEWAGAVKPKPIA